MRRQFVGWMKPGDVKCALGYIVAHAAEYDGRYQPYHPYGFSAEQIFTIGCIYFQISKLVSSCDVAPVKIKCVIDLCMDRRI